MARCYGQGGFRLHAIFCLIAALGLTPACSSKKTQLSRGEGFDFFKNPDSNQACLQTNLSQWELSGAFVHRMLVCASNRSTDGGETLPATQNLLKSLDAAKLQTLIDFALTPDTTAVDQESRYPYLIALSMLLDRGLDDAQKAGLDLSSERLDELQGFLLSLDPDRVQKQISAWSRSGHLETLLAQMGIFLQALADDSLSALSREMLEGSKLGPHALAVSAAVLGQEPLMNAVDAALSADAMQNPDPASRSTLLETWRQPLSVGTPRSATTAPPINSSEGSTTFVKHLDQFSKGLSDDEIQRLSRFLSSFWDAYRNLPEGERNSVSQRLARGLEQGLDQQQNPVQWMLSMAQDLNSMSASDLNPLTDTLYQLLTPASSPTLDGLRAKVWASRMHENLVNLLYQGGEVPGCSNLTIPGLKTLPRDNFGAYFGLMKLVTEPHGSCNALQAPLSAAVEAWTQVVVGDDSDTRPCEAPCIKLKPASRAASVTKNYWSGSYQEPDAALIQRLVSDMFIQIRKASEHDPYHLRNLGVARTAVNTAVIDQWVERWNKAPATNLQDLARWDTQLTGEEPYRSLLMPDAMETLLGLRISELQSLSEQFHELMPDLAATNDEIIKNTNRRASRVFAGVYSQGPMEQALRSKLPVDGSEGDLLNDRSIPWPENVRTIFAHNPALYSHKLASFKFADAIFRNAELGAMFDPISTPLSGLGNSDQFVKFDAQGATSLYLSTNDLKLIQPSQSIRPVVDLVDMSPWGLWKKRGEEGALGSKDLPPAVAQSYIDFYPQLLEAMTDSDRWMDLNQPTEPRWNAEAIGIDPAFFDVQPYTPAQARLLTLYYLRQYHKLPNAFPQSMQVSGGVDFKLGFRSAAAVVSTIEQDFTLFAKLFPEVLSQGATLEDIVQNAASVADDGQVFAPAQLSTVNAVSGWPTDAKLNENKSLTDKVDRLKLLSTLNLLSTTDVATRKLYVQPLIGYGGSSCVNKTGKPSACAIELVAPDKATAVANYKNFIADLVAQQYCPLINSETFGSPAVWSKRLALQQTTKETCRSMRFTAAPVSDDIRFPAWLTKRILSDVFAMGQKAELKTGLAQVPAALRYYKLGQNPQTPDFAQQWLRSAVGNWSAVSAASSMRRQFYAFSFWAGQPNLVGSYLDVWNTSIAASEWGQFMKSLGQYDELNQPHDVIYELFAAVIEVQRKNAAERQSLLKTVLDTFDVIAQRKDFTDAAGHILANYALSDNYDFAAGTLPAAVILYIDTIKTWDWNQPGLRLTKFFAQNEMLRTGSGLSKLFSPSDFSRFVAQFREASDLLGTPEQRSDLFARFTRETLDLGLLTDASQLTLSERWNQILQAWRFARFDPNVTASWDAMLAGLKLPLVTTDGRPAASAGEFLNQALPVILRQGTGLWALHQDSQPVQEQAFWSKLALNMVKAIQSQPLGARALSRFAADPHLGFIKGGIWIRGMNDATTRRNMTAALASMVAVSENLWHAALVESSEMLGRLSKALGYMSTHLVWKPDPANNAYRRFINQLYLVSSEEALREDQITLLNSWLQKEEEPEPSGSTLAAGSL